MENLLFLNLLSCGDIIHPPLDITARMSGIYVPIHIVPSVRLVFPIYEADSSEHWYHFAGVLVPFCSLTLFQQLQAL